MNSKIKIALIVIVVIIVSALVSFVSIVAFAGKSDRIFAGVSFEGISLGNKTRDQAGQEILRYENTLRDKVIDVEFNGGHGNFSLAQLDLKVNRDQIIEKAFTVGRNGNYFSQWQERKTVANNGIEIPVEIQFSKDKLRALLDEMTKGVRVPPRDAKIVITPQNTVDIVESSDGTGVEIEDAFRQVGEIIKNHGSANINLQFVPLKPAQSTEDVINLKVNGIMVQFTTWFDLKKENRTDNIRIAANALDGYMIKPGEEFSFNKVVGPRSQEAGYKSAKIVLNNRFVEDLGGGVCQVSTTLYNALLQADVKVLERSSHSLVITYIPLGQDAAVAYGVKDLRFVNNLPCAIIMKTSISGNSLTFRLFGDTSLKKNVQITNNIIKEYPFKIVYKNDANLPVGSQVVEQKGSKGYRVTSKISVYQGGVLLSSKQLSASYYKPLDQIVLVGTKPVPQKPVAGGGDTQPTPPGTTEPGTKPSEPPVTPVTPPPIEPPPGTGTQPEPPPAPPPPPPAPVPEPQPSNGTEPVPPVN